MKKVLFVVIDGIAYADGVLYVGIGVAVAERPESP